MRQIIEELMTEYALAQAVAALDTCFGRAMYLHVQDSIEKTLQGYNAKLEAIGEQPVDLRPILAKSWGTMCQ